MAKKQFKAESKRLLELMIHSIYTHKEIFLRELISNASDANDKLNYLSIQEQAHVDRSDLTIQIHINKEERWISITDSGIGMNEKELEENLGTIAQSGSRLFKEQLDQPVDDVDVIGQFGVGFYSGFMVAKRIEVETRKYNESQGYRWVSEVTDGYQISTIDKDTTGTTVKLYLKDNEDDENFDAYLEQSMIERLIKKYSDYIRYPIVMDIVTVIDEVETVESKTLNSMVPIWKKNKNEITKEEYNDFYQSKFNDFSEPLKTIHMNVEGTISFSALLFIPSMKPFNFYSQDYEKGLQLYSRGVFIMDKASELIPEHFRFVKGLVDSQDLSLNISRELLQHDRQLKQIATRIEKKIKSELESMLNQDRETYEKFWNEFGLQLKYGVYNEFGMHKDMIQDLLLFYSSRKQGLVTLKEYVEGMKEGQDVIYFASGETIAKVDAMPQVEKVKDKDLEILYMTDSVDEFALQVLNSYMDKVFKNVNQGDLDIDTEEEKEELTKKTEASKDMLEALKDALKDEVKEVRLSSHLKTHPVCLVSADGISFEMEKVLSQMPDNNQAMKAGRILEINADHPIFNALESAYKTKGDVSQYAELLYNQALLIEGFSIEDPVKFSNLMCDLMIQANK